MMRLRTTIPSLLGALTLAAVAGRASAQQVVRVRVTDSTGVAIPDADVSLVHGLQTVVARGATDATGARTLGGALGRGEFALVVRKIGFVRVDRFVPLQGRDTLSFDVVLRPVTTTLDAVTVKANEDLRRKRYFIDADAIASTRTTVLDALDIVTRLRPDMIRGLSGNCGAVSNVWVNGDRIINVVPDYALQQEQAMMEDARRLARATHIAMPPRADVPIGVSTVLAGIKPEHVAEIRYHDCDDLSLQRSGGSPALFIVLKPGIKYLPTQGSFVAPVRTAARGKGSRGAPLARATSVATGLTFAGDTLARFRFRLLGVYDAASGEPLAGVHVIDVATGVDASTTNTGTVSLYFLRPGPNTIRLTRAGYEPLELAVTIAPSDTVPITAVLAKP